jgi:NADPH-dependent 2,4-dienoyl-CoA reductase/sulfur reductase-like enzyme
MHDLIVVGAGPAGLAAAIEARRHGLDVLLLDEQDAPGGQIWRAIERNAASGKTLDADYAAGAEIARAFRASGAAAEFGASVWNVASDGSVAWTKAGIADTARAEHVLLATGALERAMPLPGWTLPGVMTIGAAQILLKSARLVPKGRVWLAGQGPLLELYATQLLHAGAKLAGIVDLQPRGATIAALKFASGALGASRAVAKGWRWRRNIASAGIVRYVADSVEALGDDTLRAIRIRRNITTSEEPADTVLLHDGVVPNVQITRALGLEHFWHEPQRCFVPRVDAWGRSSQPSIRIAGDGAGILGAVAARAGGALAALAIACERGRIDTATRDRLAAPWLQIRERESGLRRFLDALFPPRLAATGIDDNTIICRCEEVTADTLREAARLGCLGPNQLKAFARCGMGPCQGRICGLAVSEVIAEARGVDVNEVGYFRLRFPTKPVTLGELAAMWEKR